jgi:eukaryotic-like serine/threonine-protein kinase
MNVQNVKYIGHGGFGIVDKVVDENGNYYAKKTFAVNQGPGFTDDMRDNVKRRFIREAERQGAINHPNIVPIVYTALQAEPPYYIMALAESSLVQDISQDRTLKGNYMDAILNILDGLEEMHSIGYYHRDLKPANILRFTDNGADYYAIADFGLISINQTRVSNLTTPGMKITSDYYTAPEIVKDLASGTAQSDIYSLGCILHDMIGTEDRIPCGEINENHGEYAGILRNCTRRDPDRRFNDIKSLREALLSVGKVLEGPVTSESEKFFQLLANWSTIDDVTTKTIGDLITYLEDHVDQEDSIRLLKNISTQQIEMIFDKSSMHANKLGLQFAHWIRNNAFVFSFCDELALKLEVFIRRGNVNTQAECLMAMLYLGTSHNRWYVEKMFIKYANHNMNDGLAKRLAIEFINDSQKASDAVDHLQHSISFTPSELHPQLFEGYKKIIS